MLSDKEILEKSRKKFELQIEETEMINFYEIFGNGNPVHIEIGSGRGEFLIKSAIKDPDQNYIGIDLKEKRIKTILRKLFQQNLSNVRIARIFLDEQTLNFIPANSIETIHLQYPDPWPKKRHHHRRIIQHNFIDILHKLLKKEGVIDISTDHAEYAEWIIEHFNSREDFIPLYKKGFTREPAKEHVVTYFEMIKREEGFEPFFMKYRSI